MKIDFHVHTNLSPCSVMKPRLAVKVAKKKGLDAIAIVNHNKLLKYNTKEFKVIPGEEIRAKQGEIIGIFLKNEIKPNLDAQKTINLIKKQGGIAILPHVFDPLRRGLGKHIYELHNYDFIEYNGRCLLSRFNAKVLEFSKNNKVPVIGGSDAHYYEEIGSVITEVNSKTIDDAINKLLKGKGKIVENSIGLKKYMCYIKSPIRSALRKALKYL